MNVIVANLVKPIAAFVTFLLTTKCLLQVRRSWRKTLFLSLVESTQQPIYFTKRYTKYTIVDAIKDENVLRFGVEYVGRYRKKDDANEVNIEVQNIDTKELMESDARLEKIMVIIEQHGRKTHSKTFTSMFCVSNYYGINEIL